MIGGRLAANLPSPPSQGIAAMSSPFRRHRQKVLARLAAEKAGKADAEGMAPPMPEDSPATTEYRGLLAALQDDLRTLHDIQSVETKIERKRSMITAYIPWCKGVLEATEETSAPQDEIVVTIMIWSLDIQEWDAALDLAEHCLRHGLQLPERYNRTLGCLVVEEIAEYAIKHADGDAAPVPLEVLQRTAPLLAHDMPDQVKAKFHRALGECWARMAESYDPSADSAPAGGKPALVDAALTELRRAVSLHGKVGSKKQIEQLEREAKKLAQAAGQNAKE